MTFTFSSILKHPVICLEKNSRLDIKLIKINQSKYINIIYKNTLRAVVIGIKFKSTKLYIGQNACYYFLKDLIKQNSKQSKLMFLYVLYTY